MAFTGVLAVSTVGLWIATMFLYKGSERTAKKQLRAYLYVEHRLLSTANGTFRFAVNTKNSGQTPAYRVRTIFSSRMQLPQKEADFHQGRDYESAMTLSPDSAASMDWTDEITQEEVADISAGTKGLFVFSTVEYLDIFGDEQTTRTRVRWQPQGSRLIFCNEGNDHT